MYCLYIRKCQTCRNVRDCRATWESLGVGKKYQLMSPGPLLTELQPLQAAAGVGHQRGNTKGNADPWVRDNKVAPQKTGGTVRRVRLAWCTVIFIWPLRVFAVIREPLLGQVPAHLGHRSCELSGVGVMLTEQGAGVNSLHH